VSCQEDHLAGSLDLALDGPFWDWRGRPGIRRPQPMTMDTRHQRITLSPFSGPLATYPPYTDAVTWDRIQLAYFMGTAWSSTAAARCTCATPTASPT
jgi:hypothetical protein